MSMGMAASMTVVAGVMLSFVVVALFAAVRIWLEDRRLAREESSPDEDKPVH